MDVQHGHADQRRPGREAALRAVQKPPTKPWRGTGASASPPPPPKVYRVEPREFRDLVQRLTGAPPTATATARGVRQQQQQMAPVRAEEQQLYAPWFSFPLAGLDVHRGNGALM